MSESTAFSSVKHKGLKYVPLSMCSKKDALDPPIPEVEDKSMRGIAHPQLARWLCPRNRLDISIMTQMSEILPPFSLLTN